MLQAQARPWAAVRGTHGGRGKTGLALPGAVGTRQEPAQGPLEVPHEERVDDGVHGAVAVTQPREDIKELRGDAVAHGLEGWGTSCLVLEEGRGPPRPARMGQTHKHMERQPALLPPRVWAGVGLRASPTRRGLTCPLW